MTAELTKVDPKQYGLEESKATQMREGLTPIIEERMILAEQYQRVIIQELNDATLKEARELRLKIRDNRTKGIEKWHSANKEFYLRGGQFVDAIKKVEILENERMEDNLLSIEKHFENLEKEKQEAIHNKRLALITPYVDDTTALDFRTMQDDVFEAFLSAKKSAFEARIEAEKKAEAERLEAIRIENERIEAQRIENERLKKEAEIKESELKRIEAIKAKRNNELRPFIVFIRDYNAMLNMSDADYKKEFEEIKKGAELQWEFERKEVIRKQQEEERQQAIIEKQKIENDRIAKELRAKQDAEIQATKEREALELQAKKEAEKLAKAPIKKQLQVWVNEMNIGKVPEHDIALEIKKKFDAFKLWSLQQIDSL